LTAATSPSWRFQNGQEAQGELLDVYGGVAVLGSKKQLTLASIPQLDPAGLDRVAAFLAARPPEALCTLWRDSKSPVATAAMKRLRVLSDDKLVAFDPGERAEPDLYLVYFSAHWCGPCRRFTPALRAAYEKLRAHPQLGTRFELIFISSDESAAAQLTYAKEAAMPWPMIDFRQLGRVGVLERRAGDGIPCLVVIDRQGRALLHSYQGAEYIGPQAVLEKFATLLAQLKTNTPAAKRALHPLAIRQHLLAAAGKKTGAPTLLVGARHRSLRKFHAEKFHGISHDRSGRRRRTCTHRTRVARQR
jgi:thiol-disulfide isomerase/thioredoxin